MLRENFKYVSKITSEEAGKSGESDPCSGALTFIDAFKYCEEQGGRLPTREEAKTILPGTGCGYDSKFIWTCEKGNTENTYWCIYGAANGTREDEERKITDTAYVRWVYDSQNITNPVIFNGISETKFNKNGIVDSKSFSECGITDNLVAWMPLDVDLTDISTNKQPIDVSTLISRSLRGWEFAGDDTNSALSHIKYPNYSISDNATITVWAKHGKEPLSMKSDSKNINIVDRYNIDDNINYFTFFKKSNFININEIILDDNYSFSVDIKAPYDGARMIVGSGNSSNNCLFINDGKIFFCDTTSKTIITSKVVVKNDEYTNITIKKKEGIVKLYVNNEWILSDTFGTFKFSQIGTRQNGSFSFNGIIANLKVVNDEGLVLNLKLNEKYPSDFSNGVLTLQNFNGSEFVEYTEINDNIFKNNDGEVINTNISFDKNVQQGDFRYFTKLDHLNSNYITLNNNVTLDSNFNIKLKFSTTNVNQNKQIMSDPNNDRISITKDNILQFRLNNTILTGTTYVTDGKLHNVEIDRVGDNVNVYLDDKLEISGEINSGTINFNVIGALNNLTQYFNGIISDIIIKNDNDTLLDIKIDQNYNNNNKIVSDSTEVAIINNQAISSLYYIRDDYFENEEGNILKYFVEEEKTFLTSFNGIKKQYIDLKEPLLLNEDFTISFNFSTTEQSTALVGGNAFADSISVDVLDGRVRCWSRTGGTTNSILIATPKAPRATYSDGNLHNVKIVYTKDDNNVMLFVNNEYFDNGSWPFDGNQNIRYIGGRLDVQGYTTGIISDFKITGDSGIKLHMPIDGYYAENAVNVVDLSGNFVPELINATDNMSSDYNEYDDYFEKNNNIITKDYSNSKIRKFSKFASSLQSYIGIEPLYLGTEDFELNIDFSVLGIRPLVSSNDNQNEIVVDTHDNKVRVFARNNGVLQDIVYSNNEYTDGEFHNVNLKYEKGLNKVTLTVDDNDISTGTWVLSSDNNIDTIGARINNGSYMDGYISNFEVISNNINVNMPIDGDYLTNSNIVLDDYGNIQGTFYNCKESTVFTKENNTWVSNNLWDKGQQTLFLNDAASDTLYLDIDRVYKIHDIPDGVLVNFGPGWLPHEDIFIAPNNTIRFLNVSGEESVTFTPVIREVISIPTKRESNEFIYLTKFEDSRLIPNKFLQVYGKWEFKIDFRTNVNGHLLSCEDLNNNISIEMLDGQIIVNAISNGVQLDQIISSNNYNDNNFHVLKLTYDNISKIAELSIDDSIENNCIWNFSNRPIIKYIGNDTLNSNGWNGELKNILISIDGTVQFEESLTDYYDVGNNELKESFLENIKEQSLKYYHDGDVLKSENLSRIESTEILGDDKDPEFSALGINSELNQYYEYHARITYYEGSGDAGFTSDESVIPRSFPFRKSNMKINDTIGGVHKSLGEGHWIALFGRSSSHVKYDDISVKKIIKHGIEENKDSRYFTEFSSLNQTYIKLDNNIVLNDNFEISFDYCGTADVDSLHILGSENVDWRIFVFSNNLYIKNLNYKLCSAKTICDGFNHTIKLIRKDNVIRAYIDGGYVGSTPFNDEQLKFSYIGRWRNNNFSDGIISNILIKGNNEVLLDMKINENLKYNKNVIDESGLNGGVLINEAKEYIKATKFKEYWQFENIIGYIEPDEIDKGWNQIGTNIFESNNVGAHSSIRYYQMLNEKSQYKVSFNLSGHDNNSSVSIQTNDIPRINESGDGDYTRIVRNISNNNLVISRYGEFNKGTIRIDEVRKVIKNLDDKNNFIVHFDPAIQTHAELDSTITLNTDFEIHIDFSWNDFDTSGEECLLSESRYGNFLMLKGSKNTKPSSVLFRSSPAPDLNFDNVLLENNKLNTLILKREGKLLTINLNGVTNSNILTEVQPFKIKYIGVRETISHFNGMIDNLKIYDKSEPVCFIDFNNEYNTRDNLLINKFDNNHGKLINIKTDNVIKYYGNDNYLLSDNIIDVNESPILGSATEKEIYNINANITPRLTYDIGAKVKSVAGTNGVGFDNDSQMLFKINDANIGDTVGGTFIAGENNALNLFSEINTYVSFDEISLKHKIEKQEQQLSKRYFTELSSTNFIHSSNKIVLLDDFEIKFDMVFYTSGIWRSNILSGHNFDKRIEIIYFQNTGELRLWTSEKRPIVNIDISDIQDDLLHNVHVKYKNDILTIYIDGDAKSTLNVELPDDMEFDFMGRNSFNDETFSTYENIFSNFEVIVKDEKIIDLKLDKEYIIANQAICNDVHIKDYKKIDLDLFSSKWNTSSITTNYENGSLTLQRNTTGWEGIIFDYTFKSNTKYLIKMSFETVGIFSMNAYFNDSNKIVVPNNTSNVIEFILETGDTDEFLNIISESNSDSAKAVIYNVEIQDVTHTLNNFVMTNPVTDLYEPTYSIDGMLWTLETDENGKLDLWFKDDKILLNTGDGTSNMFNTNIINDTEWHNYTVSLDSSNTIANLYIDGQFAGNAEYKNPTMTNKNIYIGSYHTGQYSFDGLISDFRLYDYCMSAEDINIQNSLSNPDNNTKMKITDGGLYVKGQLKEI